MDAHPTGAGHVHGHMAERGSVGSHLPSKGDRRAAGGAGISGGEAAEPRPARGGAARVAVHHRPALRTAHARAAGRGPVDRGAARRGTRPHRRRDQPLPAGAAPRGDARGRLPRRGPRRGADAGGGPVAPLRAPAAPAPRSLALPAAPPYIGRRNPLPGPSYIGRRTCRWLSWCTSAWTRPAGPARPVFGPTKITSA